MTHEIRFADARSAAYRGALANDGVVGMLNELLENAHDGDYGYRVCSEELDDSSTLKRVFRDRADQCRAAGADLAALVTQYGGTPVEGGSACGAVHRGWVHVKAAVGANSELSMLEECERGDAAALARYRKALKQDLPIDVLALVQRQADAAQRDHDQMRDLRDQMRVRK